MATIVPAILPTSRYDLEEKLLRLRDITEDVQIDIVDGKFAAPASWPYSEGTDEFAKNGTLPAVDDFRCEMDLMVENPEAVTGTWIAAGAVRILAHLESTTYLPRLITDLKEKYGLEKGLAPNLLSFGVALNLDTNPELIEPYLSDIDYVQFMGIRRIGVQGQPFAPEVLHKIAIFRGKHPDIPVQVDGGVTLESAAGLLSAGVSRLIVGSALWRAPDLQEAYDSFVALTETHGLYE